MSESEQQIEELRQVQGQIRQDMRTVRWLLGGVVILLLLLGVGLLLYTHPKALWGRG